jgi:hypothetical protein
MKDLASAKEVEKEPPLIKPTPKECPAIIARKSQEDAICDSVRPVDHAKTSVSTADISAGQTQASTAPSKPQPAGASAKDVVEKGSVANYPERLPPLGLPKDVWYAIVTFLSVYILAPLVVEAIKVRMAKHHPLRGGDAEAQQ